MKYLTPFSKRTTQLALLAIVLMVFVESGYIEQISKTCFVVVNDINPSFEGKLADFASYNVPGNALKSSASDTTYPFSNSQSHPHTTLAERLERYLKENEANGFSGAVLVAVKDEIIMEKGFGLADREKSIPVTAKTVFDIGSITKQFTGAAVLKLVEQEKLNLTDNLTDYFEEVPDDKKDITIHQLLTHTSGISSYTADDYELVSRDDFLRTVFQRELEAKPGEQYIYSNVGYSILGIIIEKVSGIDYERFLNEQLFQPAGMNYTGYLQPDWDDLNVAIGYDFIKNQNWGTSLDRWQEDRGISWNLKANGGILSTVKDMYRWHVALEDYRILSPDLKELYEQPHVVRNSGGRTEHYAYGWVINTTERNTKAIVHNGGNYIFFAIMGRFVDEGVVVVLMTNEWRRDVGLMSKQLIEMIFDPELSPEPIPKPSKMKRWKEKFDRIF